MSKDFKEEWDGLVELSEEEEKFENPEIEKVAIERLPSDKFLSRIKIQRPEVIFISRNGGSINDVGGNGQFEAWFIDKDKERRVETCFNYEYGYYALRHSLSKISFFEETNPDFLCDLLIDIFEHEGKYFIFRIKTLKIGGEPLDFSWRIPQYLI
jgi:hypothetical protein